MEAKSLWNLIKKWVPIIAGAIISSLLDQKKKEKDYEKMKKDILNELRK